VSAKQPILVGQHPLMQKIVQLIAKVAPTDASVLVLGESGTGKELVARALHAGSPRAHHAFIPVNCGAISPELFESELFGHERGAFTGASNARAGFFQLADGGTIFLDEVGELPAPMQVKLLRALQDHEIRPVGAERLVKVDVRVIAATNRDLVTDVTRGTFRDDLFYRLQVIPIIVPPLRERRSDVTLLVDDFLKRSNAKTGRHVEIPDETLVSLWEYDWPGNVRELENVLERVVTLAESERIRVDDLPIEVRTYVAERRAPRPSFGTDSIDLFTAVDRFEDALIDQALHRTRGNKEQASRLLGLKRTTLVAKLRRRAMPAHLRHAVVIDEDAMDAHVTDELEPPPLPRTFASR
jgi:two-component system response regulator PilR (NtrC family)